MQGALFIALAAASPARAQMASPQKPAPTQARYIAMLYGKLIGRAPDFEQMARDTQEYKTASPVQAVAVVREKSKQFEQAYTLLTGADPVTVTPEVQISAYSPLGHGYLVQNFNDMTFFDFVYGGQHYALVPSHITDYRWLKDFPEDAKAIMRETQNGYHAHMVFVLTPTAADPKPMEMNGKQYRLIMADVTKAEMWSQDGKSVIWDSTMNDPGSMESRIMNLFQH